MRRDWRCLECGKGTVRLTATVGRKTRYKQLPELEIPETLEIPTCDVCGEEFYNADLAEQLDKALEQIYREQLARIASEAIDELVRHAPQSSIERHLGLAQGYLSKIRSGTRRPSADLALHLAMIALDPANRLQEAALVLSSGFETALDFHKKARLKQALRLVPGGARDAFNETDSSAWTEALRDDHSPLITEHLGSSRRQMTVSTRTSRHAKVAGKSDEMTVVA